MQVHQPVNRAHSCAPLAVLRGWWRRSATRRALGTLDARQLKDIGLTDRDRAAECAKWFWQA